MGSNEIRLRKQKLNPGRIASHRDYAELMRKHKRGLKTKQILLLVVYIIIVLLLILLSFIAVRVEKNKEEKNTNSLDQWSDQTTSFFVDASNSGVRNNKSITSPTGFR